nr:glycerophosphodiester phosphodiesterase [Anaerolineae bacterium]
MTPHEMAHTMFPAGQTLVFGHRGAKAYAPMNTLPAFELAATQGAHGIELDVHRSRDGYPVIVHDFTVDHTTDGRGLVTALTLAELKALDAGSWFSPAFAGTRIPTLDEVFAAVGQRLYINVEIKAAHEDSDGVEQVVADCIVRHAMQRRVLVSSFNPLT